MPTYILEIQLVFWPRKQLVTLIEINRNKFCSQEPLAGQGGSILEITAVDIRTMFVTKSTRKRKKSDETRISLQGHVLLWVGEQAPK